MGVNDVHPGQGGTGAGDQNEVDGDKVFSDDPQSGHRRERILCGGHSTLDRVFDRDHRRDRTTVCHVGERLTDIVDRAPRLADSLWHLAEGRFGAGTAKKVTSTEGIPCPRVRRSSLTPLIRATSLPRESLGARGMILPADLVHARESPTQTARALFGESSASRLRCLSSRRSSSPCRLRCRNRSRGWGTFVPPRKGLWWVRSPTGLR